MVASIQSLGVGSGLLTSELIEDIIKAERNATDLRLETRKAEVQARISAVGSVRNQLANVQSAAAALNSRTAILATTSNVSQTGVLNVSATTSAVPGNHDIEVTQLARAHTLTSATFVGVDSTIATGTLTFRFGTTTYDVDGNYDEFTADAEAGGGTVTITSSNNTLGGLKDAINQANLGVTASIVDDGDGFRLALRSTSTGVNRSVEIVTTAGLEAFAYNENAAVAGTNFSESQRALDALLRVDGVAIRRTSNAISNVIEGVSLNLTGENDGNPLTLTIGRDTSTLTTRIQAFVDAYNSAKTVVDSVTAFDAENQVAGLLLGDASVRNLMAQLRRSLTKTIENLPLGSASSLAAVGISSDQNNGFKLKFDADKLQQALERDAEAVVGLFASSSRASDPNVRVITDGSFSKAGIYEVSLARTATRSSLSGATVAGLSGPIVIDSANDNLKVNINGVTTEEITLTNGTYATGADLAAEIEQKINADTNLRAANVRAEVNFDSGSNQLQIQSLVFGTTSKVGIVEVDTDTTSELGLSVVNAATNVGLNAVGTINGVGLVGAAQTLLVPGGAINLSSGQYFGNQIASFSSPLQVTSANKTFVLKVDGVTSASITIDDGSYASGQSLADEIENKINADANLSLENKSVEVSYDDGGRFFKITSESSGKTSTVEVMSADAGTIESLGLFVGQGIAGNEASAVANAAAGVALRFVGGGVGERGQVTVVRGIMSDLDGLFDVALGVSGSIDRKLEVFNSQLTEINDESTRFNRRIDALEVRLRTQFAAADALISRLNNTQAFLAQQLANLPGFTRPDDNG